MSDTTAHNVGVVHTLTISNIGTGWSAGATSAVSWEIDGTDMTAGVSGSTAATATLRDFDFSIPSGVVPTVIDDITVRVVGSSGTVDFNAVLCQLWVDGAVFGTELSTGLSSTAYDKSFSGWATLPTEAQIETSTDFGVVVKWEGIPGPGASVTADGVTIVVSYTTGNTVSGRIYNRLSSYDTVTDLVSTRIFPNKMPQKFKYPSVVYRQISDDVEHAMGGDPNINHTRYQIACLAESFEDAEEVGLAVSSALSRWSSSTESRIIQEVFIEGAFTNWVDVDDSDVGVHNYELNVVIHVN